MPKRIYITGISKLVPVAACLLLFILPSCKSSTINSECAWVKPIQPSRADVLTHDTKLAIVNHNDKYKEFCK